MRPRKPWYRKNRRGWYVEVDGRQVCLVKGEKSAETKALADHNYHALMIELAANPPVDNGNPTVASVIDAFLDFAAKHNAENTFYERKLYLQKFADVHGGWLVTACRAHHLQKWVDDHPTWRSEATKSNAIRIVKRAFNWGVEQELIPKNPFANIKHREGDARRPMTEQEYLALLKMAGAGTHLGETLRFIAGTGCRPCEARHLCWDQVDLERRVAIQHQHKTARTQKSTKPRIIMLSAQIVELLRHIRERGDHPKHVFVSRREMPWGRCSLAQAVRRLRRAAKLADDVVLYGLRHHFGTASIKNGNDLKVTAELMGHSTTRMTEHYVHLSGDPHLLQAAERATNWPSNA